MSIFIIAILVSFFYSNIIDFFGKVNVSSKSETVFDIDPNELLLDTENFVFAVGIA